MSKQGAAKKVGRTSRDRASSNGARAKPATKTSRRRHSSPRFPGRIVRVGERDAAVVLAIQRRLNAAGCGPVKEDGVFGKVTDAAVRLFQARSLDVDGEPLAIDGLVGAVTWGALFGRAATAARGSDPLPPLLDAAITVARSQVGVMESPPKSNRGPEVDRYLESVGHDPRRGGVPWCAAFVHFCFAEAAHRVRQKNAVIRTAGVLDHWQRALSKGIPTIGAGKAHIHEALVRPGQIFIIDTGDPGGAGHTGLIVDVSAGKLTTIEGNTNEGGSRDGIGVFQREGRRIRDVNVGFIDYGAR